MKMVRCDKCETTVTEDVASHWLVLGRVYKHAAFEDGSKEKHFCTHKCLRNYAEQSYDGGGEPVHRRGMVT